MQGFSIIAITLVVGLTTTAASRTLILNEDPTPDELFGLFCKTKIGQKLVKCQEEEESEPKGKMSKEGKGKRHRRVSVHDKEDFFMKFTALSSEDKQRFLIAMSQDDAPTMEHIFTGTRRQLINSLNEDPTPDEFFGLFCNTKIGQKLVKCQEEEEPKGMMSKEGKGKRHRRASVHDKEDVFMKFTALSSEDKQRFLIAMSQDDAPFMEKILTDNW